VEHSNPDMKKVGKIPACFTITRLNLEFYINVMREPSKAETGKKLRLNA
jgi:hypothetical protein